jgi:WD40 repeat protein
VFSPDDQSILAGDFYTGLSIWNLTTGEQQPVASGSFFTTPVYSPDGHYLAAYDTRLDALVVYGLPAGEQIFAPLPMIDYVRSLVFSPDSTQLVVVMDNLIQVYALPQGNLLHQLEAMEGDTFGALVYASDGRVLFFGDRSQEDFSGSFLGAFDQQASGVQLLTLAEWPSGLDSGQFSRDGQLLLNVGRDGVEIYATANGALVWRGQADPLNWRNAYAFTADSRGLLAYIAQGSGRLEWWNLTRVHDSAAGQPREAGRLGTPAAIMLNGLANLPVIALPTPGPDAITPQNAGTLSETLRIGGGAPRLASWAPDGRSIALSTARGIALADPDTLAETALFPLDAPALSVAFSPTGLWLAGGAENGAVVVWEKSSGRIVRQFSAGSIPTRLAFSPDGSWLAFPDGPYAISIYDISNGSLVQRLEGVKYSVSDLCFDQGGKRLFAKDAYGGIHQWDIATGVVSGSFNAPAFEPTELWTFSQSADRRYLVAGTQQSVFFLWDTTSQNMILSKSVDDDFYTRAYQRGVSAVAVSTPTHLVAAAGDRFNIYLSTFPAGEPAVTLAGHQARLVQLAFSPDGLKLLSLDETGVLKIWNARTGQVLQTAGQFPGELAHLSIGADGALNAAFGDTYQRYSLLDGRLLAQDGGFDGAVLALSPDGTWAAVFNWLAGWMGEIRLWNLPERRQVITLEGSPTGGPGSSQGNFDQAAFSPDSSTLLSTGFTASYLWHIPDGEPMQNFYAFDPEMACTMDGQLCAISDYQQNLSFWNGITGQRIGEVGIIGDSDPIALHPAGKFLAIRHLNHIRLVDLASGTWQDSLAIAGLDATTLAFSPDGSLLAVGSRNGRVYIFASSNMALVRELPAHAQEIRSILFTPDCTRMITAGADGLIIVWKP